VLPIRPTLDWTQAKAFTKAIATLLAGNLPGQFTASMSKEKRKGRIFIDYLRNAEGATAIAPYAFRARDNAPVSMPIPWEALKGRDLRYDYFNVGNAARRMAAMKADPWADFGAVRQTITAAMLESVGT
jgi:bifunctional non-homologous end joining protein LigD